ncbi:MAG: hypothetical protein NC177_16370 [Ruminococcus flavefaciens]|nr:hypothetical protein [Ruminococcus flavefaciens]
MRATDAIWRKWVAKDDYFLDTKLVIGNKEYTSITAPKISRKAIDKPLSIGGCFSASMTVSVLTDNVLDAAVPIVVRSRVVHDDESSGYIDFGTFYIDKREKSVSGMLTLSCFDSMLKANQPYLLGDESESDWPKSMAIVVQECAAKIGVPVDSRTNLLIKNGLAYTVSYPKELTVMQVLSYIGACFGGNWIITEENKLRIIPVVPDAQSAYTVNVPVVLESLTTGEEMNVSGVSINDGSLTYEAGSADGKRIIAEGILYASQSVCNDLSEAYTNRIYRPFSAAKARFDPATELGDRVILGDKVDSFLMCAELTLGKVFLCGISAPDCEETESEYPYPSKFDMVKAEANQYTDEVVKDAIQETTENTDNMAVALGYYKTIQAGADGSEYAYYHNFPKLNDSTYIFYFGGNGMLWANSWGDSHDKTMWISSIDARGNVVMETINAKKITADAINVTDLSAFDATIANWIITSARIEKDNVLLNSDGTWKSGYRTGIQSGGTAAFYAGCKTKAGGTIANTSASNFYVTHDGKLYAQDAYIKGEIVTTKGTVGGWTIGTTTISQTNGDYTVTLANYANSNEASRVFHCAINGTDTFLIRRNGKIVAKEADFYDTTQENGYRVSVVNGQLRLGYGNKYYAEIAYEDDGGKWISFQPSTSIPDVMFFGLDGSKGLKMNNTAKTWAGVKYFHEISGGVSFENHIISSEHIILAGAKYLKAVKSSNGTDVVSLIGLSSGDNIVIGAANGSTPNQAGNINFYTTDSINMKATGGINLGWDGVTGSTNIFGNDIALKVKNLATPTSYRPYLRQGDSFEITIDTAGYVTSSGTKVCFIIPCTRYILGNPTVTVRTGSTYGNGFILRQGGKYTHGSNVANNTDTYVRPSSYSATLVPNIGIRVAATFSNTTNVTNNDAIGVLWNGTISFS